MIVKTAMAVTDMLQSSHRPLQSTLYLAKTTTDEAAVPRDLDDRNAKINFSEGRHSLELSRVQLRLAISLMFAVLPGGTLIPSLAHGLAPSISASAPPPIPKIDAVVPSSVMISNSLPSDANSNSQPTRQSLDAARLLLEDYSLKKRPKIPASVKRQMDMQDNRLADCRESSEAGNWDQCFFYGMDTATSDGDVGGEKATYSYFGNGVTSPTPSSPTAVGKSKIPTW